MGADIVLSQVEKSMFRMPPCFQFSHDRMILSGTGTSGNGGYTAVCLCESSSCKLKLSVLYALHCMHLIPELKKRKTHAR